jgi:uncharacterized protein (TIGR03437 family)
VCVPVLIGGLAAHAQAAIRLTPLVSGLPGVTDIQHAGDGSGRLFIVQQNGIIRILKGSSLLPEPFLDLRSRTSGRGEQGLLGLAFPPDYGRKQYFYLNYTNLAGDTVIARYMASTDPDKADGTSESILLMIDQPYANHNGGQLRFGPDGFMYIGMGDGGSSNDPMNNAQNGRTLLGKMLRIDTEREPGRYRIPPDNPFASSTAFLPEIWAYGLRNPWRFSFDRATSDLWIGDVGQNRAEEIDFQPASSRGGENYGWKLMEGLQCVAAGCNTTGLVVPVAEYTRAGGCSVTGGFVYRGRRFPTLRGTYIYGDYCTGNLWGITRAGDSWNNQLLLASREVISTFGEDEAQELYLAGYNSGTIFRVEGDEALTLTPNAVVNAASFVPGLVAGSAATIFISGILDAPGIVQADRLPLPDTIGGIRVLVNDSPAPLYSAAHVNGTEQVNFQVPFEIEGSNRASISVLKGSVSSATVDVDVLAAQPGVFSTSGTTGLVVHHSDNTLVSPDRPVLPSELAYFYTTGLGAVENRPATGSIAPFDPQARVLTAPQVSLGGVECEVLFAGLAPGLVGVYQVNIRVPSGVAAGSAQLVVTQGGSTSKPVDVPVG